jgi:hypothetical protein
LRVDKEHAAEFPTIEVTLPWIDPDRPNLAWDERPLKTFSLLVTTPRTNGGSGGAVNRVTWDDKQWKPALVRAGVLAPPKVTLRPGCWEETVGPEGMEHAPRGRLPRPAPYVRQRGGVGR